MQWDQSKYLEPKLTKLSEKDAIIAIREALKEELGEYPSNETLAIIVSQIMLETGRLKSMYNYNFGNVKSRPNDGHYWTMYKCSEIINGKEVFFEPPHDQCKFKAHLTATDGAKFHIHFLNGSRYKKALSKALIGDVEQYTIELKNAGYFTANLSRYISTMKSLYKEFSKKVNALDFSQKPVAISQLSAKPDLSLDSPLEIPIAVELPKAPKENNLPKISLKKFNIITVLTFIITLVTLLLSLIKC